jgi:hypothetical protein
LASPRGPPVQYTVREAAEDWLENGLPGRSAKTIRKNKDVPEPILMVIGTGKLRELDAAAVDTALKAMAGSYGNRAADEPGGARRCNWHALTAG